MKIAIIAEGSYPYVAGGVSSWTNQLITAINEHEFIVISIMPSRNEKLEYKYKLPQNVKGVYTIYLDDYYVQNPTQKKHDIKVNLKLKSEVKKILTFDDSIDLEYIIKLITDKKKFGTTIQFLQSELFWNLILEIYHNDYEEFSLNEFFWSLRSMYLNMFNIIQSEIPKADLYHSVSTGYSGLIGLIGKIKYSSTFLVTEHGIYPREREEELLKAKWVKGIYKKMWIDFFYFISKSTYKKADMIISLFNRSRDIQLELGSSSENTMVIPNGVSQIFFDIEKKPHYKKNIAAIVRVVPIKDIKTLLRAFKIVLSEQRNDIKFYIIGPKDEDEDYYEECIKLRDRLNLNNIVEFTGRVDVKEYLKIIDCLVLTSLSEGQPLVMLEGMAAAIPFVATDVGSCRELIEGNNDEFGVAGIITKPVSPIETAEGIIEIISDDKKRTEMGINGKKRVKKYYSHKMFIENYKKLYKRFGD